MIRARHRPVCQQLAVIGRWLSCPPPASSPRPAATTGRRSHFVALAKGGLGGDRSHARTTPPSSRTTPITLGPARSPHRVCLSASLPPAPGRARMSTSSGSPSALQARYPRPYPTRPTSSTSASTPQKSSASTPQNSSKALPSASFVIHATGERCVPDPSAAYLAPIPHVPCPENPRPAVMRHEPTPHHIGAESPCHTCRQATDKTGPADEPEWACTDGQRPSTCKRRNRPHLPPLPSLPRGPATTPRARPPPTISVALRACLPHSSPLRHQPPGVPCAVVSCAATASPLPASLRVLASPVAPASLPSRAYVATAPPRSPGVSALRADVPRAGVGRRGAGAVPPASLPAPRVFSIRV